MGRKKLEDLSEQELLDRQIDDAFSTDDVGVLTKDMKKLLKEHKMGRDEMRFLVDTYYQLQQKRIATQGQIRSIEQNADESPDSTHQILTWYFDKQYSMEKSVLKMLDIATGMSPTGRWMKATMGIGPALSASLLSMFDISKGATSAGHFHSYAGLNDNICPRIGSDKAKKIIAEAVEEGGLTEETLAKTFAKYGRTWSRVAHKCYVKDKNGNPKKFKDGYHLSQAEAVKALSYIPYNANLKKTCWLVSQQFLKLINNPKSKYGKILTERRIYETEKNERGEYREQAEKALREKNYTKGTDTYNSLIEGKLSAGQILARAERYAVKIFISHLFECMYIEYYGIKSYEDLPVPYAIAYLDHTDYILPEVPYSDVFPGYVDRPC